MRAQVLRLLKERACSSFISGEEMARTFSVSRTAIWKTINSLQSAGYRIESSPRLGYRLLEVPDLLYPEELWGEMQTGIIAAAPDFLHHYRRLESTSETLKAMAERRAPEGTVVIAEEQTRGRGRMGRTWASPHARGIWMSVLFRPSLEPSGTPLFTLFSAVAVVKSLKKLLPNLEAGIKWPNDILASSRKICGILTEMKAEADLLHYVVTGIGINVNTRREEFPPDLQDTATSVYLESGRTEFPRAVLAAKILEELDRAYRDFLDGGPAPVIAAWKEHELTLGKNIAIQNPGERCCGRAVDLDESGALIVEDEKGSRRLFRAGEVTLSREARAPRKKEKE